MTNWFDINEWVPPAMRRRQRMPDLGQRGPIVELLAAISSEVTGREVVYEGATNASAVIESFEVVDPATAWAMATPPSSVATAIRGEIRDPMWGEHRVDRISFEAHDVELAHSMVTEVSVALFELKVEVSVPTMREWIEHLGVQIELVGIRDGSLVLRWKRWPRRAATITGTPHAAGRRLYARIDEVRLPWGALDLGGGPEFHVAAALGELAPSARLTDASIMDDHLVVSAEVRNFHMPVRPHQIRAALRDGEGKVTLSGLN